MNGLFLLLTYISLPIFAANALHAIRADSNPLIPWPVNKFVDNGTYGYYPTDTYATAEKLNGPRTNFLQWSEECNDGSLYFITPRGWGIQNPGPMLLDARGRLIWAKHFANKFGGQAYDFIVQTYQGQDYLTFWLGDDRVRGHGSGFFYMLNSSYDIVHRIGAANGLSADLHEFLITPEGTALMIMYQVTEHDLTSFPEYKPDEARPGSSYIWDCVFQEIDIATGNLVHEWRASDHISINATYRRIGPGGSKNDPFDWFHMNSIAKDELGNYLISARYVHSLTYIDGVTGEIIWTLGGDMNDFMDLSGGNATRFAWQHDARFLPLDTFPNMYSPPEERDGYTTRLVTMFDNAAEDQHYEWGMSLSRGLLLEMTYPNHRSSPDKSSNGRAGVREDGPGRNDQKVIDINGTDPDYVVRVVKSYEGPERIRSSSQGSVQILPQGGGKDPKVFVGYGLNAIWTEFESDGTVLCNAHYAATTSWERGDIQSYRTYKFPWVGTPESPPEVDISDDDAEVYVSWNGATEVVHWILQCSERNTEDEKSWEDLVQVSREDFETAILVPDEDGSVSRYLRVIALDKGGRRLDHGTSRILDRAAVLPYLAASHIPLRQAVTQHFTPLKIFMALFFAGCTALFSFGLYRRYLKWRSGKPSSGPLRWRKGLAYRLLGEA